MNPTEDPTTDPTVDSTTEPTVDPTTEPTVDPTTDLTVDPTTEPEMDLTDEPILDPIHAPTVNPLVDTTSARSGLVTNTTIIIAASILWITIVALSCWTYRNGNKRTRKNSTDTRTPGPIQLSNLFNAPRTIQTVNSLSGDFYGSPEVRNGVIACIPIGKYDDSNYHQLPVRRDVQNLKKLSTFLGYKFIEIPNKEYWTKENVKDFLINEVGGKLFHKKSGDPKYDCLVVCITGHGQRHSVVTSNGEAFDRSDIHRCISLAYPKIRDIPRIFIFDACAGGSKRRDTVILKYDDDEKSLRKKRRRMTWKLPKMDFRVRSE